MSKGIVKPTKVKTAPQPAVDDTLRAQSPAPSGPPVLMVGSSGQFYEFPQSSVELAQQNGFQLPSQEQILERDREAKYGDRSGAAFGLGIARGLTLGGSDVVAGLNEKLPAQYRILPKGTAEAVSQIKQRNEGASTAGELSSFLVPVAGELAAGTKIGKAAIGAGAAQKLITRAGRGAANLVADAAPSALAKYLAPAAQFATEAAMYQTAKDLSEAVLENRDLTAESILSNVPKAALFGGTIGIAMPIAKMIAQPVIKTADRALNSAIKRTADFFDPDRSLQLYSGAMGNSRLLRDTIEGNKFQDAVANLRKSGMYEPGEMAFNPATGAMEQISKGGMPNQRQAYERMVQAADDASNALKSTFRSVDGVSQLDDVFRAKMSMFDDLAERRILQKIDDMASNGVVRDAEALRAEVGYYKKLFQDKGGSLEGLQDLKQGLYERIGELNFNRPGSPEAKILKDIARTVKESIEDGVNIAKIRYPDISGDLGNVAKLNRFIGDILAVKKPLDVLIQKGEANVNVGGLRWRDMLASGGGSAVGGAIGGPVGAAIGAGAGPLNKMLQTGEGLLWRAKLGEQIKALSWVRDQANRTEGLISSALRKFAERSTSRIADQAGLAGVSQVTSPLERYTEAQTWFQKTRKEITGAIEDLPAVARRYENDNEHLDEHAPEVAESIVAKRLEVLSYLADKMPKDHSFGIQPFRGDYTPTDSEIREFRQRVETAKNPLSVLESLKNGRATRVQIETLKDLYPQIYTSVVSQATKIAAESKMPYQSRVQLSLLLGAPMDRTMTPQFIETMQGLSTATPKEEKNSIRQSSKNVDFANRNQSQSERIAGR